jgi:hypothetical protein
VVTIGMLGGIAPGYVEVELFIRPDDSPVPVLRTTRIQVEAVGQALGAA